MSWKPPVPNPEFAPNWDVSRDEDGEPITITEAQMWAIWHAIDVVESVRRTWGHMSIWDNGKHELMKSRLLGRMLLDGKPPTRSKPPMTAGGPDWAGLPGGDPFS